MFFHGGFLNRMSLRTAILLIVANFLCAIAIIAMYAYQVFTDTTTLAILLFLNLLLIGILTQSIFSKHFKNKMDITKRNVVKYPLEDFKTLHSKLSDCERRKYPFGSTYFMYRDKTAIKVTVVDNAELYFQSIEKEKENVSSKENKKLKECTKYCGFEIFNEANQEETKRIAFFSFQSEKIYFAGCAYKAEEKMLYHYNYEKPAEGFSTDIDFLLSKLGLYAI